VAYGRSSPARKSTHVWPRLGGRGIFLRDCPAGEEVPRPATASGVTSGVGDAAASSCIPREYSAEVTTLGSRPSRLRLRRQGGEKAEAGPQIYKKMKRRVYETRNMCLTLKGAPACFGWTR
jgi:hypothetical protein